MKLLKTAAMALAVSLATGAAWASEADVFRSPTLGIELPKPEGWRYSTAAEAYEDAKLMEAVGVRGATKAFRVPLVAMLEEGDTPETLTPSLKLIVLPYGPGCDMDCLDPKKAVTGMMQAYSKVLDGFRAVAPPVKYHLSDHKAGYGRFDYVLSGADGEPVDVQSALWVIPTQHYVLIATGAAPDPGEPTGGVAKAQKIMSEIKIKRGGDQ